MNSREQTNKYLRINLPKKAKRWKTMRDIEEKMKRKNLEN